MIFMYFFLGIFILATIFIWYMFFSIDDLKDFAGNKINEYTMSLFIANHAEHLMNHPQATDDFKEILRDLSQNRKSFATKRLRSTLKRALKKSKQEHQSI